MTETTPMIAVRQLRKRLGRRAVLQGLDVEVARGERVALIGSNGAGKTTLIRCLLGEYHYSGSVAVAGCDPQRERTAVLGRIGFVPQLPPPLRMPVEQLVRYVAAVSGADPQRIKAVAGRLGFEPDRFRHQPFVRLSGGQKQKLLIAAALGRDVDLLVMDEPAANLDPEARAVFFDLLAARQDDAAMLISSHRLDEVAALVNRVLELDQGRVVLDDRVADDVDLGVRLACELSLARPEAAFANALAPWGFRDRGDGLRWQGTIAGADRLRFLGVLSRYAGLLEHVELGRQSDSDATTARPGSAIKGATS
ncbi:MAG: ABC transporter ATP-binding protein [Pseudohaliea sp.]